MSIKYVRGDMFDFPADVRINACNCEGVMGKGIALQFKKQRPWCVEQYQLWCDKGWMKPGGVCIVANSTPPNEIVIHAATKKLWRYDSRYNWVAMTLRGIRGFLALQDRERVVTMPALGCGNGGLSWASVKQMIERRLASLECTILVFEPND